LWVTPGADDGWIITLIQQFKRRRFNMKTFKGYWPIPAYLVFLAAILGLFQTGPTKPQAATSSGAPVVVTNTPLPISPTGTQTVSGTVGISGTPSVSISGTPTVGIDPSANTVTLLREPENPARQPFAGGMDCVFSLSSSCTNFTGIPVPSGKELVIEFVSASVTSDTGVKSTGFGLNVQTANGLVAHSFGPTFQSDNGTVAISIGSFPTGLYADGSSVVALGCSLSASSTFGSCIVTISGYLVNVP
jgi:hypothetical protein